ncbi:hypothetical protein BDY21DRAFT_357190 [Lineolata rhizophorae]|uniref:Aminoglycoside phosphotransferase domain-containing protein n=1 Tax=Lineolata rhizophorae TaxID=578093 RepID=A0A6A6NP28_9PEZI|nr:hypothetical protein BDY21DRAFT_357190 [Lineolata rhizophorae]
MLDDLEGDRRTRAFENVDSYVKSHVLPQLHRLRSSRLGPLTGEVFPPNRVLAIDKRRVWPKRHAVAGEEFVYCHNDLAQHNIFVDAETLQVISIIDWEYSGFFPREVELPLWLKSAVDWGPIDKAEAERLREIMLRHGPDPVGKGVVQEAPILVASDALLDTDGLEHSATAPGFRKDVILVAHRAKVNEC